MKVLEEENKDKKKWGGYEREGGKAKKESENELGKGY